MFNIQYFGGKAKVAKYIVPFLESQRKEGQKYLEPFIGGANIVAKMGGQRYACDFNEYLIEMYKAVQQGYELPNELNEEQYKYIKNNKDENKALTGFVGFGCSFAGKWFGGYVERNDKKHRGDIYSYKSCVKQSANLQGIKFINKNFQELPSDKIKNYVIYCDIPYRNTTNYKTDKFPYDEFYNWVKVMSIHNTVLISEYWMPEEFQCIWSKECKTLLDSNKSSDDENNIRIEKLFTYKINLE